MEYSIQALDNTNIKQTNFASSMPAVKKQKVDLTYLADSVSFGNNNTKNGSKKGMSKWLKAGLISIAAIGVGVLAYVLTRGKIGSKEVKQLAEHIDFKEAKTLEEAMEFGKTHLGIKEYKGFEERDLEVINWVNEGFVNVSNRLKGRAVMPETVNYTTESIGKGLENFFQSASADKKRYTTNKNIYSNIDNEIEEWLSLVMTTDAKGNVLFTRTQCGDENFNFLLDMVKKYKTGQHFGFKEKVKLFNNINDYITSAAVKMEYEPVSEFSINFHECGHLLTKSVQKYVKKPVDQQMAELISYRAKANQAECFAEWFRKYMERIKVAPEATEYVKKLGGIPVEELL